MSTVTEIEVYEKKALSVPDQAKAMTVSNNDEYLRGEELLATCKQIEKEIHSAFDPIVVKTDQAHKEAVATRKKYLEPIEEGRRILKGKMIAYQDEQERLRQEEQRRLDEAARKQAEDEALAIAAQLEQSGDTEAAEAVISKPVQVAPVIVPRITPKASRLSAGRETWFAEVTDLRLLCKAVGEGKQPLSLIEPHMPSLNKIASALHQSMNIPGVVAKSRKV